MKITNTFAPLSIENREKLQEIRKHRAFDVQRYVMCKTDILINYMKNAGLTTCVVAMSGGIDSAVVFALLHEASKKSGIKVFPVSLPSLNDNGVTNQLTSVQKAEKLVRAITKRYCNICQIQDTVKEIASVIETMAAFENMQPSNWARGQLVPYTRTPYLYYIATLLKEQGNPAIIVGTTNRDEGAYLGYVGKASDGMVDIQLISDLHKSEVYQVAKHLNIPQEIIAATPTGDMFDGKSDEDIFGASYDSVEYYLNVRHDGQDGKNLQKVHDYNAHKYLIGSPAVHLDIYESGVEDGWPLQFESKYWKELKKRGDFIAPNFVAPLAFTTFSFDYVDTRHNQTSECVQQLNNLLSDNEIEQLRNHYNNGRKLFANVFGYTDPASYLDKEDVKASSRASFYNVALAAKLWERIRPHIELLIEANVPLTDWKEGEMYRAVGVNPLFRFIGYSDKGKLVPHYDYTYDNGETKTLFTLIIYLTTNKSGGTRFIKDVQVEEWTKNLDDWTVEQAKTVKSEDCNLIVRPKAGNAIIFPHHLLHDAEMVVDEEKLIIRTDIVCEKIRHS